MKDVRFNSVVVLVLGLIIAFLVAFIHYDWPEVQWWHAGVKYNIWTEVVLDAVRIILFSGFFAGILLYKTSFHKKKILGVVVFFGLQLILLSGALLIEGVTYWNWVHSTGGSQMIGVPSFFSEHYHTASIIAPTFFSALLSSVYWNNSPKLVTKD